MLINMDYQKILKELKPDKDFFIGIDSDGCVFDTMELKQKEFFWKYYQKRYEKKHPPLCLFHTRLHVNIFHHQLTGCYPL